MREGERGERKRGREGGSETKRGREREREREGGRERERVIGPGTAKHNNMRHVPVRNESPNRVQFCANPVRPKTRTGLFARQDH